MATADTQRQPMSDESWDSLAVVIEEWWKGEFSESESLAWRAGLAYFDPGAVLTALRSLLLKGEPFHPSLGEVIAELSHDPKRPEFEDMVVEIYERPEGVVRQRTSIRKAFWEPGERDTVNRLARLDALLDVHPAVAEFYRAQGDEHMLSSDPFDQEYGPQRRHRLRAEWDAFMERWDAGERRAIASGERTGALRRPFGGEIER
jgi:hypothetical protein